MVDVWSKQRAAVSPAMLCVPVLAALPYVLDLFPVASSSSDDGPVARALVAFSCTSCVAVWASLSCSTHANAVLEFHVVNTGPGTQSVALEVAFVDDSGAEANGMSP